MVHQLWRISPYDLWNAGVPSDPVARWAPPRHRDRCNAAAWRSAVWSAALARPTGWGQVGWLQPLGQ